MNKEQFIKELEDIGFISGERLNMLRKSFEVEEYIGISDVKEKKNRDVFVFYHTPVLDKGFLDVSIWVDNLTNLHNCVFKGSIKTIDEFNYVFNVCFRGYILQDV